MLCYYHVHERNHGKGCVKMRICHVTSAHNNKDVRIFEKEAISLAKIDNYDVHLVAEGDSRKERGVTVHGLGKIPTGKLERFFSFSKKIIKKAKELDADIYHLHDPELLLYALQLKKMGKKVIFDSHENTVSQIMIKNYIPRFLRPLISKVYYHFETYVTNRIDGVIFPAYINGKHLFENRCKTVEIIDNTPILDELVYYGDRNDIKACYVGSLSRNRGVYEAIKACQLAGVKLILVGKFDSEEFQQELEDQGLLEGVDYRGYCSRKEVYDVYRESSIGLSTIANIGQYHTVENLPTKVYEYMSMGMAIICSDFKYSRRVFAELKPGVVVDPSNPELIAQELKKMVSDVEQLSCMQRNSRQAALRRFNWSIDEKKLYSFYEKIIKE